eukprot:GHRQ01003914.1.p1 GENE.GHRQ01003914.1~~GHRQ01003914.1.p1  ORF type:complete len:227 (+),score=84.86 GHRQ01003914.1:67-747(+)
MRPPDAFVSTSSSRCIAALVCMHAWIDLNSMQGDGSSRLQVVAGDVTDAASLPAAVNDAAGVIFAASGRGYWSAEAVDNKGVKNVADACKAAGGVGRVVLVSSMLTHPSNRLHPVRVLLNNIRWSLMDHKYAGEEALRGSGVPFTVVRPGGLTNKPAGETQLRIDVNATKEASPGSISRADVAAVCVEALSNPAAANKTLSVHGTKQPLGDGQSLNGEIARLFGSV